MSWLRRLSALEEHGRTLRRTHEPASHKWLAVLKAVLPRVEEQSAQDGKVVLRRVRYSIRLLEEYVEHHEAKSPWAYLEYFCSACILRLGYSGPEWEGKQFAFVEDDYDAHIAGIESLERRRLSP